MHPRGTHLLKNVFDEELPTAVRAEGVFVFDSEGKRYLDGCSGAVTVNVGHGNPRVLEAIKVQSQQMTFVHRGAFNNEPSERLASKLSEMTDYPYVYLSSSGSEGVEAAMKFALQYWQDRGEPQRSWFMSHAIGYHGATIGGLSLSGHPQRRGVAESLLYKFNSLTPPYSYRYAEGLEDDAFCKLLLDRASAAFAESAHTMAAVVVEPLGGAAGGAITPPAGYLAGLAALCREHGILLITDEVMCGLGRTGDMLAAQHSDVYSDIAVLGKGLGSGYSPTSAVLLSERVYEVIAAGSAVVTGGHTYGGNPLSSAVALASLEELDSRDLTAAAARRGRQLAEGLRALADKHYAIGEVRGRGLLQGLELVSDRETREPGKPLGSLTQRLIVSARHEGLLVYPATGGTNDGVLIAPPLTTSSEEIAELLGLLDKSLEGLE